MGSPAPVMLRCAIKHRSTVCLTTLWSLHLMPAPRVPADRCAQPVGGATRDALDSLIASHALGLGVTLVTNNEADFQAFAGLAIENWVEKHVR